MSTCSVPKEKEARNSSATYYSRLRLFHVEEDIIKVNKEWVIRSVGEELSHSDDAEPAFDEYAPTCAS